jgi:hypothetical protein
MMAIGIPLIVWSLNPYLWPVTPERINRHVESFSAAPFSTASWNNWEIVARWAVDSGLEPDLTRPRRLLAEEIAGDQNRYILSSALRVGLLPADQVGPLREYATLRRSLLSNQPGADSLAGHLSQYDWVIRVALMRGDLSAEERDLLAERLHGVLERFSTDPFANLETPLRVTDLLEVIGRPIDRERYRQQVHDWLRKAHTTDWGGFQLAGGFRSYLNRPDGGWLGQPGSLEATAYAVELMEIYGIPEGLDLNWVRSFLRPLSFRTQEHKWIAAATLERLNRLPGAKRPTWLEVLYHERALLAAVALVGLCMYATLTSPRSTTANSVTGAKIDPSATE